MALTPRRDRPHIRGGWRVAEATATPRRRRSARGEQRRGGAGVEHALDGDTSFQGTPHDGRGLGRRQHCKQMHQVIQVKRRVAPAYRPRRSSRHGPWYLDDGLTRVIQVRWAETCCPAAAMINGIPSFSPLRRRVSVVAESKGWRCSSANQVVAPGSGCEVVGRHLDRAQQRRAYSSHDSISSSVSSSVDEGNTGAARAESISACASNRPRPEAAEGAAHRQPLHRRALAWRPRLAAPLPTHHQPASAGWRKASSSTAVRHPWRSPDGPMASPSKS